MCHLAIEGKGRDITQVIGNHMEAFCIDHRVLHGLSKSSKRYFQTNGTKSQNVTVYRSLWNVMLMCFAYIILLNAVDMQHTRDITDINSGESMLLAYMCFSGVRDIILEAHECCSGARCY